MADQQTTPNPGRVAHQPALDGLRGLAVTAVLLFHAGFGWARGGFLGVSTFFTLSGFLITSLLLVERARSGRIDLGAFWVRRARRLLPAALLGLAGVVLFGLLVADPEQVRALRGDGLAALGYVANWRFIFSGKSYAALFSAPSPLQHYWSLAIEEQFYVLFPLLVAGLLAVGRGSRRVLAAALVLLAAGSVGLMFHLYQPGFDPSRVYYGTDTRAAELLAGALLAVWMARAATRSGRRSSSVVVPLLGTIGLAVTVAAWIAVSQTSSGLYRGGLVVVALATVAIIRAAVHPSGPVRRVLSVRPLRFLGTISYGVYLFHWPLFLWLTARRTGLPALPLFALRLAVTLAAALLSYYLLEQPIRTGRWLTPPRRLARLPVAGAVVAAAFVVTTLRLPAPVIDFASASSVSSSHPVVEAAPVSAAPVTAASAEASPTPPPAPPTKVMVVGDSVAYVIGKGLERVGAESGRLLVWDVAIPGCGLARGGDVIGLGGIRAHSTPGCDAWAERWTRQLGEFHPDVVLVMTGSWDMVPRLRSEWSGFRTMGDPVYDNWLLAEYQSAVDVLGSQGAKVVWLSSPCMHRPGGPQSGTFDPARTTTLDGQILPALAASRPALHLVDLFDRVCPGGAFAGTLNGLDNARPDGVHFSDPAADWLAAWLAPQLTGG